MANVLFTRKNASEIPNVPITDGQLIFDTSGNGKMYLDNGTRRLEMGGALTVDATLSKTSTNPVQNKAVAGVMLDTLSDISNVTSKGFLADALAVKELNNNLTASDNLQFKFGKDGDGNYGYYGADGSLIPFSKVYSYHYFLNLGDNTDFDVSFTAENKSTAYIDMRSNYGGKYIYLNGTKIYSGNVSGIKLELTKNDVLRIYVNMDSGSRIGLVSCTIVSAFPINNVFQ